ncbi:MAG: hypothetical protein M4579_003547 [Chaenotheca gracillima]|nr:MAG: hypothetical protein M4579_003547 [Chaenotheca gracillima]
MKSTFTSSLVQLALTLSLLRVEPAGAAPTDDATVQAAYHVIYSYPGVTPPAHLLDLVGQGKVGGICLFGENIDENTGSVIENLQSTYASSPYSDGTPLLIMTDQEGGEVRRVSGGPELSEKEVGVSATPSTAATTAGKQASSALADLSINANLAPVLGVYREEGNFLDKDERSYSNDSAVVGDCGSAFITAQQAGGAIATAKHFPGLGAATTTENTDAAPVTLNVPLSELRSVDQAPYKKAIAAGVDMVMPSWAVYPALDAKNPSGLSKAWVQDELRGRLGFKGVTVTDAIEAGSLKAFGDDGQRGVLASQAGVDLILASGRNATQGEVVLNALVSALNSKTLPSGPFSDATKRIVSLRGKVA